MEIFLYFYQHIPEYLSPTIGVGFFSISWYALMYLVGFITVYLLLRYRIRRGELNEITNSKLQITNKLQIKNTKSKKEQNNFIFNFLVYAFIGLVTGARIGYVIFYDFGYYLDNPLSIISPFDAAGNFIGIYGMSYHGGLLGVLFASWIFCRKNKIGFLALADFAVPAIPAGYFFGRVGNFLNGELYGRVTEKFWGMYFPTDYLGALRHPSQLYEAFFEGLVLFLLLWLVRNRFRVKGETLALYLIGYATFRIFCEFFREPDSQIGFIFGYLTLGQIFSMAMVVFGLVIFEKKSKVWYNKIIGGD